MALAIPEAQVKFAQLAVQQRFISPEQVRSALELYRRYQAVGGDVPSVGRILVARHLLTMQKAEAILRHIMKGEALPAAAVPAPLGPGALAADPEFEVVEDLGLEPPGSQIDLPVSSNPNIKPMDEREALIQGLGATVLRKELREIKGYKITQVVGEGSMGIVYRAHQVSMDRTVALKVLPPEKARDQRFVNEFLSDARNAGRLNHPNLIRVHEVGMQNGTYFYSMEYVEGQRLDEWMDECEGGRLDPRDVVNVFSQVAGALDYGFRCGVVHREIRPNSIMVSEDKQAKLSDLGLVKDEQAGFLEGENAYYVAPEQVRGGQVDTRADIYCLGCCMFHCLTGEPPFGGGTPKDVLQRRLKVPAPNPRQTNPDVPPELAAIVIRMMAREPGERYQTPAEVAEALKNIAFSTARAVKTPPRFPPRRPMGRPGAPGANRAAQLRRRRYR